MTSIGEIIAAHDERGRVGEEDAAHGAVAERVADAGAQAREPAVLGVGMRGRERAARGQRDASWRRRCPALTHSPALTPKPATTRPPSAGPMAKQSEKETLSSVLPASSWPSGLSVAATAARVSARPTSARMPSDRGQHEHERQPRRRREQRQRREDRGLGEVERRQHAADADAVELRGGRRSDEAPGPAACRATAPVVASALCVWSKTSRPSATVPKPQPSSLSV